MASNLSGETEVIGQRVKLVPWNRRSSNRAEAKWTSYLRGSSPRARTASRTTCDQVSGLGDEQDLLHAVLRSVRGRARRQNRPRGERGKPEREGDTHAQNSAPLSLTSRSFCAIANAGLMRPPFRGAAARDPSCGSAPSRRDHPTVRSLIYERRLLKHPKCLQTPVEGQKDSIAVSGSNNSPTDLMLVTPFLLRISHSCLCINSIPSETPWLLSSPNARAARSMLPATKAAPSSTQQMRTLRDAHFVSWFAV